MQKILSTDDVFEIIEKHFQTEHSNNQEIDFLQYQVDEKGVFRGVVCQLGNRNITA